MYRSDNFIHVIQCLTETDRLSDLSLRVTIIPGRARLHHQVLISRIYDHHSITTTYKIAKTKPKAPVILPLRTVLRAIEVPPKNFIAGLRRVLI